MRHERHHRGRDRGDKGERARVRPGDPIEIYGLHAALAALANPERQISNVFATENGEQRLSDDLARRKILAARVQPRELDRRLGGEAVHQGVLIEALPLAVPSLAELTAGPPGIIVVLDQVTDPHNVGAILRSAAAFGARGLVMTARHSPPLTGALAKSASGGLEHVPVALVANLARAMAELADLGVHRIGLDGEAEGTIEAEGGAGLIALVLGAEGRGLRRLTREHCDRLCRISTSGALASLNVSNAAAVALHALAQAKGRR